MITTVWPPLSLQCMQLKVKQHTRSWTGLKGTFGEKMRLFFWTLWNQRHLMIWSAHWTDADTTCGLSRASTNANGCFLKRFKVEEALIKTLTLQYSSVQLSQPSDSASLLACDWQAEAPPTGSSFWPRPSSHSQFLVPVKMQNGLENVFIHCSFAVFSE